MIGRQLGPFRILGKIGAGGMGEVWRARDERLERDVALKILPPSSFDDPAARARLLREARLASRLNHPHICTIHEVGEADGQAYIAMELVDGQALSARLEDGPLRPDELQRYSLQLTDAVAYAHEQGLVHRDLKSANVMVTPDGRLKVLDFGLARQLGAGERADATTVLREPTLTEAGTIVGTLAYMPPEQLRGQPADERSDVWALGVMLYEMAAGARPFRGRTTFEVSSAILSQAPDPLPSRVPARLQAVVEHCLRKEPGQRYRRASEVHAALEAVHFGTSEGPPRASLASWLRRHWRPVTAAAALALAVAGGVLAGMAWRQLLGSKAAAPAPALHALAVLPLANLSREAGQEYFVDGLTDALIDGLAQLGGSIRVISRTSTQGYAAAPKPMREIGRELGVDAVIEGSVVREGDRVRVTATLIEAATEKRLWSERYERQMTSILTLQSEIARAVAIAIQGALTPAEERVLSRARPVNPQVYEAYLKGMYYLNQSTPDAIEKGMVYLHQAVERDPTEPLAFAALAGGYLELAHGANPPPDALARAKAAALTAVELDGTLPQGLFALGAMKGYDEWDWPGAIAALRRTIELNPSFAMAHYHLAWFLALQGNLPEAIAEHTMARNLDPLNPLHTGWLGELYRMNGQYELAIAEAKKALELDPRFPPSHFVIGTTLATQGRWDDAVAAMRHVTDYDPDWQGALGAMYARAGRTVEARQVLAALRKLPSSAWNSLWIGLIHAGLGERDEAFRWLSARPQHVWMPWIFSREWAILAEPLHADPRFRSMQRAMRVPEF
jgi:serine/threonine-protein kinase